MKKTTSRRSFLRKSTIASAGLALFSTSLTSALTDDSPFEGYNPFTEFKSDLRTTFGDTVKVKGTLFDKKTLSPISGANIEVWHLSPGSTKFRHRGKLTTKKNGSYQFISDYPNKEKEKSTRIYFKVSTKNNTYFTELILSKSTNSAYITGKHWEENQQLGDKTLPKTNTFLTNTTINFNLTI